MGEITGGEKTLGENIWRGKDLAGKRPSGEKDRRGKDLPRKNRWAKDQAPFIIYKLTVQYTLIYYNASYNMSQNSILF